MPVRQECLYDMTDVWSKIQAVVELLLREYLDVENTSASRQRAPTSFDEPSTDINSFFAKKRPAKPKKWLCSDLMLRSMPSVQTAMWMTVGPLIQETCSVAPC